MYIIPKLFRDDGLLGPQPPSSFPTHFSFPIQTLFFKIDTMAVTMHFVLVSVEEVVLGRLR
jgi:hypothetical protein